MESKDILHIANIAMIDFPEEDLKNFEKDFIEIMDLIESIKTIETTDEMAFQVNDTVNNFREDQVREGFTQEEAVANAKVHKYGYFNIIKFVE
ncbi:MAG: Asp-tRNA(Asn)/Glu-tRNA(Gln) amidotransferase subunit GatC [Peptoniphilus sp.]|nr:Asp-tRNA(Asn)/Glu-tRNA(Gln) amidotransferase subunit GatC [Peptoniphilus sp.]